jgi:Protein of unknown function (DUF2490)
LFTFGPCLLAEDLQTWSLLEYSLVRTQKVRWTAEGTFRFAETLGDLYDRRGGTRLDYKIGKGVAVGGTYVFRNRREGVSFVNENRLAAGISYPMLRSAIEVQGATVYERHIVPGSDFNRYKQQFELLQHDKSLSPWLYQQFTFKQGQGFVRSRSRLGIRWRASSCTVKVAYQFESLSTGTAWAPRHAIYTEVSVDRPFWPRE